MPCCASGCVDADLLPQVPDNFMPPVPITSPIMTPLADPQSQMQQAPAPPAGTPSFQAPQLPAGQPALQGPYPPTPQPLGPCIVPPAASKPSTEGAPGAPIGNTIQVKQPCCLVGGVGCQQSLVGWEICCTSEVLCRGLNAGFVQLGLGKKDGWWQSGLGSLTCSVSQHVQALPTEKITKKPIPEEHLILKTTFEALIQRCLLSASDPVSPCGVPRASLC